MGNQPSRLNAFNKHVPIDYSNCENQKQLDCQTTKTTEINDYPMTDKVDLKVGNESPKANGHATLIQ